MCFYRETYYLPIIRHTCRMTTVTLVHAHRGVISGGQPLHSREEGPDVMTIVYIIILCELHCCSQECNPIRLPHHGYYYLARQIKLMHRSDWSVGDPICNRYIRGTRGVWDLCFTEAQGHETARGISGLNAMHPRYRNMHSLVPSLTVMITVAILEIC